MWIILDDLSKKYSIKITEFEKNILNYSTGKYSLQEMNDRFIHSDIENLRKTCKELDERCFLSFGSY